ncbi:MAG: hypothetical protein Q8P81_03935 [Nanoarchaeota archaeon]|nr:hypothetical protein [Nanoarchaeota archaeon]
MTNKSKLRRALSEYFLGTDTKEFYNRQIGIVGEFVDDKGEGEPLIRYLERDRDSALMNKYTSNVFSFISGGFCVAYFLTGYTELLDYSSGLFGSSESLRNFFAFKDRTRRMNQELLSKEIKSCFEANSRIESLDDIGDYPDLDQYPINPSDYNKRGIDISGYDGWYMPGGED